MKLKFPFGPDGLKKISKTHLLIAALFGILLLVIAIPVENKEKETENDAGIQSAETSVETASDNHAYRKNLERQLESILGKMEGVGKVEVMITMKDEGETIVEKDMTKTEEQSLEEDSAGTKRENSTRSSQEETVYIQEDSTGSVPFVARQVNPQVEGVLVVAQGGNNAVVAKKISDAILALFPVEVHKIRVVEMKE